jgi:hypothetical protein
MIQGEERELLRSEESGHSHRGGCNVAPLGLAASNCGAPDIKLAGLIWANKAVKLDTWQLRCGGLLHWSNTTIPFAASGSLIHGKV